jgi:glycosyltransferase involved in cell wall biosynthesis
MKPRVGLSMIVRNAEHDLPRCLQSAVGVVDEMVVADTGSTDRTCEIAAQYGARILKVPWEDDFAKARNQALEATDTEWVLALDADEQLDPEAQSRIPALILPPEVTGYTVTIRNYVTGFHERLWDKPPKPNDSLLASTQAYPAYTEHENVRLFRRHPQIYFVGRVHETVGRRITEIGGRLQKANFCIHHFGLAAAPETRASKNRLYRELGRRKVEEMPLDAQAHFELGLVEFDNFHNYEEALSQFHRACELKPQLAVSWLFAALAALELKRPEQALVYVQGAEAQGYRGSLVLETAADAHYNLGHFPEAARLYRKACKDRVGDSPLLQSKLALAELRCGEVDAALRRLRRALHDEPQAATLHDRLITALVFAGRLPEAAEAAETKLARVEADESAFLRAASIRAQLGQWEQVRDSVAAGLRQFPESERLRRAAAEVATSGTQR